MVIFFGNDRQNCEQRRWIGDTQTMFVMACVLGSAKVISLILGCLGADNLDRTECAVYVFEIIAVGI